MSRASVVRQIVFFLILGLTVLTAHAAGQEAGKQEGAAPPITSPQILPKVLDQGAESLKEETRDLRARVAKATDALVSAQEDYRKLEVAVATLKSYLAVERMQLSQVEEVLRLYVPMEAKIGTTLDEVNQESEKLRLTLTENAASLSSLKTEITRLRQTARPDAIPEELEDSYDNYVRQASAQQQAISRLIELDKRRWQILQDEKVLLSEIAPQLKNLQTALRTEVLNRQSAVSFKEQVAQIWKTVGAQPFRVYAWADALIRSGRAAAFFKRHPAHLVGLLAFIIILWWGARRLNRWMAPRLQAWSAQGEDIGVKGFMLFLRTLLSLAFPIALTAWVAVALGSLDLLQTDPAMITLYTLSALVLLRLATRLIASFFAGQENGGILPLDLATARYYRRYLRLFAFYALLGIASLLIADRLGFPADILESMSHLFEMGFIALSLWLLRRNHAELLLDELPGPQWLNRVKNLTVIRGVVFLLFNVALLAFLLGFNGLSSYLSRATTLTILTFILWALTCLAGKEILRIVFQPQVGFLGRKYPDQKEFLKRFYHFLRQILALLFGAAAIVVTLNFWGIAPSVLMSLAARLTWTVDLGPMKLTPINILLTVGVVYAVLWCSRFSRVFLHARVFPRTGWDIGTQYTVSTISQYVILIMGIILALNVLGFPLANLALIFGALGVGVGLGLQDVVSNFIAGLILLIERPIKVGDVLVIGGQWGEVRQIRIRSTVFQTYDRSVIIIPNSELIKEKVTNWTHYGRGMSRVGLTIGVSYDADVRQVLELLQKACEANERVLKEPRPQVSFQTYGESSLDFSISVFVRVPDDRGPVVHELNTAIFDVFKEHGIEIPFPHRELHIKNWPETLKG